MESPLPLPAPARVFARRATRALACLLVAAGAAGCARGGAAPGHAPGATSAASADANARVAMDVAQARHDSLASARAQVPDWPDAAPRDRQVPPDVLAALKGMSESWMLAWRVDLGTFRLDQLARTGTRELEENTEPYDGNAEGEDLRLTFFAMPGPSGTTAIDPYGDWSLVSERELVHARRGGAPAVSFIDLANHERRQVLVLDDRFARIDGAVWIDATRFLVLAGERFESNPWSGGPVLYVIDLNKETATRYVGPAGDYPGYQAVGRELDRRFRKQLGALVFDGA